MTLLLIVPEAKVPHVLKKFSSNVNVFVEVMPTFSKKWPSWPVWRPSLFLGTPKVTIIKWVNYSMRTICTPGMPSGLTASGDYWMRPGVPVISMKIRSSSAQSTTTIFSPHRNSSFNPITQRTFPGNYWTVKSAGPNSKIWLMLNRHFLPMPWKQRVIKNIISNQNNLCRSY